MRAWIVPGLLVLATCSRRDGGTDRPQALPMEEIGDARPKVVECDGGMCRGACRDLMHDPQHCGACDRACDETVACFLGECAKPIAWSDDVRTLMAPGLCELGLRRSLHCPSNTTPPPGPLWGTDLYTADSAVCVAARHAGLVTIAGGDLAIEIYSGAPSYLGSTRNGVTSSAWASYACSYRFVTTQGCEPPTTSCGARCSDLATAHDDCGACGTKCGPDDSCHAGKCETGIDASWSTTASDRSCKTTALPIYTYSCPPSTLPTPSVWGTDVYTNDSSICAAAVHAGKITLAAGGKVTLAMRAGLPAYKGSTRNGITTASYGPWPCGYEFR